MTKYFVMRNFRGTCSSVEMLKGYIVRGRLGTPALEEEYCWITIFVKCQYVGSFSYRLCARLNFFSFSIVCCTLRNSQASVQR